MEALKRSVFIILSVLIFNLGGVRAACPNMCSGHGSCGNDDVCSCYNNWAGGDDLTYSLGSGGDCSQRICPFERAWFDAPSASGVAHALAECGGRGLCNRDTGECECFVGYSGQGCKRADCPNECNGHGICAPINQLRDDVGDDFKYQGVNEFLDHYSHSLLNLWDSGKTMGCVCDARWSGADCSKRMCPRSNYNLYNNQVSWPEVQKVSISGATVAYQDFALLFRSRLGEEFITRPLSAYDLAYQQAMLFFTEDSATPHNLQELITAHSENMDLYSNVTSKSVQEALEELPNFVLRHVEVNLVYELGTVVPGTNPGASGAAPSVNLYLYITFSGDQTPGDQFMLECIVDPCGQYTATPYQTAANFGGGATSADGQFGAGCYPALLRPLGLSVTNGLPATSCVVENQVDTHNNQGRGTSPATILSTGLQTNAAFATSLNLECSGRGKCNYGTGVCECFEGYTDEACGTQTALI